MTVNEIKTYQHVLGVGFSDERVQRALMTLRPNHRQCLLLSDLDDMSAQQIGALIILPIAGLLVMQLTGSFLLTIPVIGFIALMLAGVNASLMLFGIALFDRESILTRWK